MKAANSEKRKTKNVPQLFVISCSLLAFNCRSHAFDFNDLDLNKVVSGSAKLAQAAIGVSDDDEAKIGREVAANLAARYGLVDDPVKVLYVNLVGRAVVKHCDRSNIPYRFGILRTAEINALAAPGGYIFITEGLLNQLKDESELAGVLAHEITHVVERHVVKAIRQSNLIGAGQDLASASGHDVSRFSQISDFSINLLSNGLSREDELEADKGGTILSSKVGYDAAGLRRSIVGLAAKQQTDLFLSRFNKTHPPAADRLKTIDQVLKNNHVPNTGHKLAERFSKTISTRVSNTQPGAILPK